MKPKLTASQVEKMINQYQAGKKVSFLCDEFHIGKTTFYNYIKTYNQAHSQDKQANGIHALSKKIKHLEEVLEIHNLVSCSPSAPLKERLAALEELHGQFSVHALCQALEVDRGTFYNHLFRNKKQEHWCIKRRKELGELVEKIFNDNHQIFGATKISAVLQEQGIPASPQYVRSIMRELGIASISPNAKQDYIRLTAKAKEDKLHKNFQVSAPNEVWVSDTSSFKLATKVCYICVIIDLFSRKVIAYKISEKHSANLISATFRLAYEERTVEQLIFHSDRGTQYTANSFMKLLHGLHVTQSFSPTGSPYHNAVMESFFATLKREEIYRHDYRSFAEFKRRIGLYMDFYNNKRPHSYLHYKTPNGFEERYYK